MFKILVKILQVINILFHPKGGISYVIRKNSSIASFNIVNAINEIIDRVDIVVDVGANIGQFATAANQVFPDVSIFSFEPIPEAYDKLCKYTKHIKKITCINEALGNKSGSLKFYKNNYSHASSALTMSDYQINTLPQTRNFIEIFVKCTRLDDVSHLIFQENKVTLLKLDVQGFEKNVLLGGERVLDKFDWILLESSFIKMYDNEPLFGEIDDFLKSKGFKILAPVGALQVNEFKPIPQLDLLYHKNDENIVI